MTKPLIKKTFLCFAILNTLIAAALSDDVPSARFNLLQYQPGSGDVSDITTTEQWQLRRAAVLKAMQSVMGDFPGDERRVDLAVETVSRRREATHDRSKNFPKAARSFVERPPSR